MTEYQQHFDERRTDPDRLVIAVLLFVLALTMSCAGCASAKSETQTVYHSGLLTIHLCNVSAMREQEKKMDLYAEDDRGLCDALHSEIWVLRQYDRPDLPDFYALGHEVWHLWTLGGQFHGR